MATGQANVEFTLNSTGPISVSTYPPTASQFDYLIGLAAVLLVFFTLVWLGYKEGNRLDKGNMRRAIAGTITVGLIVVVLICLTIGLYQQAVVMALMGLGAMVLGFYFGGLMGGKK